MMFTVIHDFKDLQDDDHIYLIGDKYPREGSNPTEKRIAELLGKRNKIGEKLIEEIDIPKKKTVKKVDKQDDQKPANAQAKKSSAKKTDK